MPPPIEIIDLTGDDDRPNPRQNARTTITFTPTPRAPVDLTADAPSISGACLGPQIVKQRSQTGYQPPKSQNPSNLNPLGSRLAHSVSSSSKPGSARLTPGSATPKSSNEASLPPPVYQIKAFAPILQTQHMVTATQPLPSKVKDYLICDSCKELGVGCDAEQPCSNCAEPGIPCLYNGFELPTRPQKKKVVELENPTTLANRASTTVHLPKHSLQGLNASIRLSPSTSTIFSSKNAQNSRNSSPGASDDIPLAQSYRISPTLAQSTGLRFESSSELLKTHPSTIVEYEKAIVAELSVFRGLMTKLEARRKSHREQVMKADLRQAKRDCQTTLPTSKPTGQFDPFTKLRSASGSAQGNGQKTMTFQIKLHGKGSSVNKWKTVVSPIFEVQSDATVLPKYKSIGRTGPSILARNVRTLKYWPYFPENESDDTTKMKKYNELHQRYENDDKSLIDQRKCKELVDMWRPWANKFVQDLKLSYQDIIFLATHGRQPGVQAILKLSPESMVAWVSGATNACPTCRIPIGTNLDSLRKRLVRPESRLLELAGLASFVFHETAQIDLCHIACTTETIAQALDSEKMTDLTKSQMCSICLLYGCPTHGMMFEADEDDFTQNHSVFINDDEAAYNVRRPAALPNISNTKKDIHQCSIFCVGRDTTLGDILGLSANGVSGKVNKSVEQDTPGLLQTETCSHSCFWNLSRRKRQKVSDMSGARMAKLSSSETELFSTLFSVYSANTRAPCLISAVIANLTCMEAFELILHTIHRTPHKEDISEGAPQGTRKVSKLQAGIDTSMSAELDERPPFVPCSHDGPCHTGADCSCARSKISCERSCNCTGNCKRRFKGCNCSGTNRVCFNDARCECWANNRECDPWLCKGCGVLEILDPINKYNEDIRRGRCRNNRIQLDLPARTIKAPSEVQGWGLFAGEDLEEHAYIGEYRGEIVSSQESDRRGAVYHNIGQEYLFVMNSEQEIDASNIGNKMRFMNNSQRDSNINVLAKKMLCNGVQRVMLYAKRRVQAGEELLYNYNYPASVVKKFWERGEQPTHYTGVAMVQTNAQQTVKGNFTKSPDSVTEVVDKPIRRNDNNTSNVNGKKRKIDGDAEDDVPIIISKRDSTNLAPAKILSEQEILVGESGDSEFEQGDEEDSSSESEHSANSTSTGEDEREVVSAALPRLISNTNRQRRILPGDRRVGGNAQRQAWDTRKRNTQTRTA